MNRCSEFNRSMAQLSRWARILLLLVVICAGEAVIVRHTPEAVVAVMAAFAGLAGVVTLQIAWTVLRVTHRRREQCQCGGVFIGRLAGVR